jgi:dynactin complex subunit
VTQTFDEVILRGDANFSGLLQKIKNAYHDYLTQLQGDCDSSYRHQKSSIEAEKRQSSELEGKLRQLSEVSKTKDTKTAELAGELERLRAQLAAMQ